MQNPKLNVRLSTFHRNIKSLRSVDVRMKMIMAQAVYQTVKAGTTNIEVTPKALSIDQSIFLKLKKDGQKTKALSTKKYFLEKPHPTSSSIPISYLDAREILIENYIEKHKIPTKQSLMIDFEKTLVTKALDDRSLKLLLNSLGFIWYKLPGTQKCVLIEDPKRVMERHHYFKQLQRYRDEGRTIVYIEESNYAVRGGLFLDLDPTVLNATKWYVIMATEHCLLKTFTYTYTLTCDYHMAFNNVNDVILPSLPKNSVIVIEETLNWENNAPRPMPTDTSTKKCMRHWLRANNIPYEATMNKAELILLVKKFTTSGKRRFDSYLKSLGHEVLRRQKGFPKLSLTEPIVKHIKQTFKAKGGLHILSVGKDIADIINACTEDQWKEMSAGLRAEEKKVYEEDMFLDEVMDKLLSLVTEVGVKGLELEDHEPEIEHYVLTLPIDKNRTVSRSKRE